MIFGIGTDLIEVERVAHKMEKKEGFKELVFSPGEIIYCETRANKYEHYAARFAAKEAFLKAIGTGWRNGTAFNEIEIYNAVEYFICCSHFIVLFESESPGIFKMQIPAGLTIKHLCHRSCCKRRCIQFPYCHRPQ